MKTILCYGDSNTYGYDPRNNSRYSKQERWPMILANSLKNYEVIEEGLNGRTTAYDRYGTNEKNGLTHFNAIYNSHYPIDIIIFMLGTNDCQIEISIDEYGIVEGMEKLILEARKNAIEVQAYIPTIILVTPAAIKDDYQNSPYAFDLNEDSIRKSHALSYLYKELANKYNCINLDCSECLEVSSIDSEHLTLNGHKKLANLLKETIINL